MVLCAADAPSPADPRWPGDPLDVILGAYAVPAVDAEVDRGDVFRRTSPICDMPTGT